MTNANAEASVQAAINAALDCVRACQICAAACLGERDVEKLRDCIRLDLDCAEICAMTADFLSRESFFQAQACQLCIDICEACAAECGEHRRMEHCRECAAACNKCAEACRAMETAMA